MFSLNSFTTQTWSFNISQRNSRLQIYCILTLKKSVFNLHELWRMNHCDCLKPQLTQFHWFLSPRSVWSSVLNQINNVQDLWTLQTELLPEGMCPRVLNSCLIKPSLCFLSVLWSWKHKLLSKSQLRFFNEYTHIINQAVESKKSKTTCVWFSMATSGI